MATAAVAPAVLAQENIGFIMKSIRFAVFRENVRLVDQALAEGLRLKPFFVDRRNNLTGRQEIVYQTDGVHLLDAGRALVAKKLARLLAGRPSRP